MGRPATNLLSRDLIVRTALEMVRRNGDFTIAGLATRLKVHASSLYHHVPGGRTEIITLIRAELYSSIPLHTLADRSIPWAQRLRQWVLSYREVSAQAPWLVPVVIGQPVQDGPTLAIYEALLGLLDEAGIPEEQWVPVATMLDIIVLGSALDAASPVPLWPNAPKRYPHLAGIAAFQDTEGRKLKGLEVAVDAAISWVQAHSERSPSTPHRP
ncbi:TetR/AcrR family transcriptional regulator C-terminal domain-containing protein [Kocuria sp. SM24M-10]|uniref:TetR/AcrR family transcriptional regulator C-terminal domain-containing protein n=1 Tax=Kocuria sp. SM24M-10 TaxID=1660349 RepID=UPI00069B0A5A|nr:TetR/AcrR family transcriptional regulator C-terminal domain-containing protein [Kocuria sp. SM24M-10]